jgi:hypothetical protein
MLVKKFYQNEPNLEANENNIEFDFYGQLPIEIENLDQEDITTHNSAICFIDLEELHQKGKLKKH